MFCGNEIGETFFVDEFHTVQRGWGSTEIIFISIMLAPHIIFNKSFIVIPRLYVPSPTFQILCLIFP